jgi:hypothetical protein
VRFVEVKFGGAAKEALGLLGESKEWMRKWPLTGRAMGSSGILRLVGRRYRLRNTQQGGTHGYSDIRD